MTDINFGKTNYSNPNYKSLPKLEAELVAVYASHYAATSKNVSGYSGQNFPEMVLLMAGDPYYNLHLVAARYVQLLVASRAATDD